MGKVKLIVNECFTGKQNPADVFTALFLSNAAALAESTKPSIIELTDRSQDSLCSGIGADVHTTQTYTQPIWSNKKSAIVKKPVVQNNTNFSQSLQINTTLYKKLSLMEKRLGR